MSKMFSAHTNPREHCMAVEEEGGPVTADKAAEEGKGGGGKCRGPATSERTSNEMHNTRTPTLPPSPRKGELDRAFANRASRGPGANGALAMYVMHRRSMRTSNSDIHCSPRPLALHAGSALARLPALIVNNLWLPGPKISPIFFRTKPQKKTTLWLNFYMVSVRDGRMRPPA